MEMLDDGNARMETLINIDVPDLHAAIEFYRRVTELELRRLLFDGTVAELAGASIRVFLLKKETGSVPVPDRSVVRDYRRHWTPLHLDFAVPDLDAALQRAIAAGATLEGPVQLSVWGRQARLSDPFGHGFCLLQWRGRGYDEVASNGRPAADSQLTTSSEEHR